MRSRTKLRIKLVCLVALITIKLAYADDPKPEPPQTYDMSATILNEHGKAALDDVATIGDGVTLCGEWKDKKDAAGNPTGEKVRSALTGCPVLTLAAMACHVLTRQWPEDLKEAHPNDARTDPGAIWAAQGRLCERIEANPKAVQLTHGNAMRLLTLMGRAYGPINMRQAYSVLGPNEVLPEVK